MIGTLQKSLGAPETDVYQMSFRGNPDELGPWRGYGAGCFGCSIETSVAELQDVADVAGWVIYRPEVEARFAANVLSGIEAVTDENVIELVVVAAASLMKHRGFEPEAEYRVLFFPAASAVKFREAGDRLVPFLTAWREGRRRSPSSESGSDLGGNEPA